MPKFYWRKHWRPFLNLLTWDHQFYLLLINLVKVEGIRKLKKFLFLQMNPKSLVLFMESKPGKPLLAIPGINSNSLLLFMESNLVSPPWQWPKPLLLLLPLRGPGSGEYARAC